MSVCLSVCLSVCPSIPLYVYVHLTICPSVCLSVCLSVWPSVPLSNHPSVCLVLSSSLLSFLSVPLGFPQTLSCTLFNTSLVPLTYALRVLGDGAGPPSGTSSQQVTKLTRVHWRSAKTRDPHARPTEFSLRPAAGTIRAMSDIFVEVTWDIFFYFTSASSSHSCTFVIALKTCTLGELPRAHVGTSHEHMNE